MLSHQMMGNLLSLFYRRGRNENNSLCDFSLFFILSSFFHWPLTPGSWSFICGGPCADTKTKVLRPACRQVPPLHLNMGACSLRSQCPHAPASRQQSWMPGSALALAKPEACLLFIYCGGDKNQELGLVIHLELLFK